MDARRLLLFRVIARAGSFSAGARELGWTQPAVSQHMSRLEREIGTPVFRRTTQGVTLTDAGQTLLRRADEVAALLTAAESEMVDFPLAGAGRVRLVAFPSALATLVPRALAALERSHPGVAVELSEAEPPEAIEALRAGTADLALTFRYEHEDAAPGLVGVPLAVEAVRLVMPARGDGAAPGAVHDLRDLREAVWAAGCPRCRAHLLRICASAGFTPRIHHTTDDYVVVQALVAQGLAVAALPASSLDAHAHPGVTAVDVPGLGARTIEAVALPGVARVPSCAALLAALSAVA
ncbi:LysR family transcriptional regulator [Propioniciclava coleopterorum]|uniref:LysR family transcriptional regulator n=1 Tax=Propioniciclava coleopterorum TaxID=2714937 RepID=A0A6G7Y6F3_9ACTN|nr:LysR family transcriptional regulator [Propioniciclava coleopterorum]QIK72201.1 LysR family transcriptional regulator [Propioniciclava coleopterorum]